MLLKFGQSPHTVKRKANPTPFSAAKYYDYYLERPLPHLCDLKTASEWCFKEKISQSCWSLLSKLYLSRNWLQSRPPATGNNQGHGSRQDLQTSHSDTATTHKNTKSNMNMTLNYNHKGSYMIIHEICHDRRSWNFFQVLCTFWILRTFYVISF